MIEPQRFPFQIFPPRVIEAAKRYRFDEELRNDPLEYQRIYEELKVEAALLVIVCISILLFGLCSEPYRYLARTPHMPRFVLWLTTTMTPRCLRVLSVLGSLELSSLQPGTSSITAFFQVKANLLGILCGR